MSFASVLEASSFILAEASVVEVLRRSRKVKLHPTLIHSLLIYDEIGRQELVELYSAYISIAEKAGFPIIILSPTWRADREKLSEAGIKKNLNRDAVELVKEIRNRFSAWKDNIFIGGCIGPKNDCYDPVEALSVKEGYEFHSWQIGRLAQTGVDFLIAETIPAVTEATGIAQAMAKTELPFFISFVINRRGRVRDGTRLEQAFRVIDSACDKAPVGYWANCSHPSFLCINEQPGIVLSRFYGIQANASSLDQTELEGAETLQVDAIPDWGRQMIELNTKYGVKILGGCCGTGPAHLQYIVNNIPSVH
jgi:S-methylmethionine-dependent homocysteine/selenocysteine methylase